MFLDYEKFRQLAWGERGQESSAYHMLINWVVKNKSSLNIIGERRNLNFIDRPIQYNV